MGNNNSDTLLQLKDKLTKYLKKSYIQSEKFYIQDLKQITLGWAGEIYSFSLFIEDELLGIKKNLILKIYSDINNGISNIEKEYQALRQLDKEGFPVPKLLLYNANMEELGRPFIIMEEIKGNLLWDSYTKAPEGTKDNLIISFVYLLFQLHSIDVKKLQPDFELEEPELLIDFELQEIKAIMENYDILKFNNIYQWLVENKENVFDLKPVVIHRDYHPWNVIEHECGDCYVIDWIWGIGDYRFDLAWTVTLMDRSGFQEVAQKILDEYKFILNNEIYSFEYFKVLATLRWIVNVISSIKSGDNLRKGSIEEFKEFLQQPIRNALLMFKDITEIEVNFTI